MSTTLTSTLRHSLRLRLAIMIGIVAILILFFLPGLAGPKGRLEAYGHDLAHFPLFASISGGLLFLWRKKQSALAKAGMVAGIAVCLVVLIEYFQPMVGRTAAFDDALLGLGGIFSAMAVYLAANSSAARWKRILHGWAGIMVVCAVLPLVLIAMDRYSAMLAFPVVDSFERPLEMGRWVPEGCHISQVKQHVTHGRYALKMEVDDSGAQYPSIFFADNPMDWRNYGRMSVDVFLAGENSKTLWIRADDTTNPSYEDRAQMPIDLKPGNNTIWLDLNVFTRTPGGRKLDAGHIVNMGLFLQGAKPGDTIYVDRMILSARAEPLPSP